MLETVSSLRNINLNLLPILAELLRCRNVTHAALHLNLTQSTVSGALRQLRSIFHDEILIQCGREMVLTEKAKRLIPQVEHLVDKTTDLFQIEEFAPLTATTIFRVATADYVSALITSRIQKILQLKAPNISLNLTPTPGSSAKDLQLGSLDLIICPNLNSNLEACGINNNSEEFASEIFIQDDWVAVQWSEHPAAGSNLSIEDYFKRSHVIYCRTDGRKTIEQEALTNLGFQQHNQFLVPYFTLIPRLIIGSDLIGLIPKSLAIEYTKLFSLHTFKPPYALPPLELTMIWSRNRESHPDLIWLRDIVREASTIPNAAQETIK